MKPATKAWYRPEIDGLRALAIIPVVLFHANIAGFTGGYVGVDIFFVISGFLITSIIIRELKNNTFSLLKFWERRMRRILPALFVVVMTTLIAGYFFVLFPIDYIDLGQSAIAQALFLANIFFMRNNGYFAGPSEHMPLLHTWSLSVEEQFYIGFPIVLLLLYKYAKRALVPTLLLIGFASLLYSMYLLSLTPNDGFTFPLGPNIWSETRNSTAAFYFLLSRIFELLIGALLALVSIKIARTSIAELVALLGLGAILYAIVFFDRTTPFPGLLALVPTLGTAAIIIANTEKQTFVGKLLSFPVFIWIGLISYSLYLWHWPLIVLGRHYDGDFILTQTETTVILILSFIAAYLSYRFIETPFRIKALCRSQSQMLITGTLAIIVMALSGWFIIAKNGLPERLPEGAKAIAVANVDFGDRRSECFVNSFNTGNTPCYLGEKDTSAVDFVIWGDSHAASLLPMIEDIAKEKKLTGATFITPACIPVSNTNAKPTIEKCQRVKEYADTFIREHNIPTVILIARWTGYQELINQEGDTPARVFAESLESMAAHYTKNGISTYIMKQVPRHPDYRSRPLTYQAAHNPDGMMLSPVSYTEHELQLSVPHLIFDQLQNQDLVTTIDPGEVLCPDLGTCFLEKDGIILYENSDHINKTGSFLLKPLFEPLLKKSAQSSDT